MTDAAAHPWVAHYPEGVRWDVDLARGTIPQLFRDTVREHADRTALIYRGPEISYADLGSRAWQVANALIRDGFGPHKTLALYLPNTAFHPFFFFGALAAGTRLAHLSPLDAPRILAHKLTDAGADTLVTINIPEMVKAAEGLLEAKVIHRVILCDERDFGDLPIPLADLPDREGFVSYSDFVAGAPDTDPQIEVAPDDVALLQYTGGTTGLPKGAMLTHANLTAAVASYDAWYSPQDETDPADTVALCVLPLFHIFALTTALLRILEGGGALILRMRFDPAQTLDDIERHRVTVFAGVPTMWIALTQQPDIERRDLSSLTLCGSGGAPLPVEVGRRFKALTGHELLGGWGMTETSPAGTNIPPGASESHPGTIGMPMPGIDMKIVDHDDPSRDLPPGEIGEIAIRGPNVTPGYWNRPDATEASFEDGWFLTSDIGKMDEDGFFYLVDRKADLILSGGFNVYPQMVEQAIYEHPDVAEVLVIGVPDDYRGESAKAFVTLREGAGPFSLEDLQAFLKDRLGRHEIPRALDFRDELPRTAVGKLSRKELRQEEAERREDGRAAQ
ncbi:MAG: AMP-binding protein [Pseudomonadota bacterium]